MENKPDNLAIEIKNNILRNRENLYNNKIADIERWLKDLSISTEIVDENFTYECSFYVIYEARNYFKKKGFDCVIERDDINESRYFLIFKF